MCVDGGGLTVGVVDLTNCELADVLRGAFSCGVDDVLSPRLSCAAFSRWGLKLTLAPVLLCVSPLGDAEATPLGESGIGLRSITNFLTDERGINAFGDMAFSLGNPLNTPPFVDAAGDPALERLSDLWDDLNPPFTLMLGDDGGITDADKLPPVDGEIGVPGDAANPLSLFSGLAGERILADALRTGFFLATAEAPPTATAVGPICGFGPRSNSGLTP